MESPCIFLGIKVKPGPIERHKLENFALDNTVDSLKIEAEKKANVPSSSLELIHHGKILKEDATLQDCGVKSGEMVHVVKKKVQATPAPPPTYTDAELQQLNTSLRTLGCTPNAPGWTRAMQLLNDDSAMAEIIEQAPSLSEDCVTLSILHEVELLAALGANIQTMRRGANAHPDLPAALRHLTRLVQTRASAGASTDNVPPSGFAYSLEALSEDEEADDDYNDDAERNPITQEQLATALQAATEAVSSSSSRGGGSQDSLLRLLQAGADSSRTTSSATESGTPTGLESSPLSGLGERPTHLIRNQDNLLRLLQAGADSSRITPSSTVTGLGERPTPYTRNHDNLLRLLQAGTYSSRTTSSATESGTPTGLGAARSVITPEMFSEAISEAINRAGSTRNTAGTPMEQSTAASSSQSPVARNEDFATQLHHMHEMGLLDDSLNVRALLICSGDVNAAINLVFSGAIGDD